MAPTIPVKDIGEAARHSFDTQCTHMLMPKTFQVKSECQIGKSARNRVRAKLSDISRQVGIATALRFLKLTIKPSAEGSAGRGKTFVIASRTESLP
jgi:hypothetical protein